MGVSSNAPILQITAKTDIVRHPIFLIIPMTILASIMNQRRTSNEFSLKTYYQLDGQGSNP